MRKPRARSTARLPPDFQGPCNATCSHVDPNGTSWPHDVRVKEDRGEIHTDDCGFNSPEAVRSNRDPGDFCTAGFPGIACRVFSRTKDLPAAPKVSVNLAFVSPEGERAFHEKGLCSGPSLCPLPPSAPVRRSTPPPKRRKPDAR